MNEIRTFSQIIKADPGYYALDLYGASRKDDSLHVHKEPVLAWFIAAEMQDDPVGSLPSSRCSKNRQEGATRPDTFITPICQERLSDLFEGAVLRPDGSVVIRGVQSWDNVAEYLKYVTAEHCNAPTLIENKREEKYAKRAEAEAKRNGSR